VLPGVAIARAGSTRPIERGIGTAQRRRRRIEQHAGRDPLEIGPQAPFGFEARAKGGVVDGLAEPGNDTAADEHAALSAERQGEIAGAASEQAEEGRERLPALSVGSFAGAGGDRPVVDRLWDDSGEPAARVIEV